MFGTLPVVINIINIKLKQRINMLDEVNLLNKKFR